MMRTTPTLAVGLAMAAAMLLPAVTSGQFMLDHCSNVCTETSACDTTCRTQTGPLQQDEEFSTCGEWGVCAYPCVADWEVISTEPKGGYTINYFTFPGYCEYYGTYLITERDVNQCGEPDRTWCFRRLEATRPDHQCCSFYFCSPDACYQP